MKRLFVILVVTCICLCLFAFITPVKASTDSTQDISWSSIQSKSKTFIDKGEAKGFESGDVVNGVVNVILTIGIVVVLAGLLIFGIKYMLASPEEASKIKGKLIGLVISAFVIIGSFGIWKLVGTIMTQTTGEEIKVVIPPQEPEPTPTPTPEPTPTPTPGSSGGGRRKKSRY